MTGTISNILQHKDYGFIYVNKIEKTVFFHSNNVADGCFAQLSDGDDVEFVLKKEKKGFIAYSVKSLEPILELENEITTISNLP
ncbi:MAG: cold shock domain-containing protein [Pseudomonadales bacterium]